MHVDDFHNFSIEEVKSFNGFLELLEGSAQGLLEVEVSELGDDGDSSANGRRTFLQRLSAAWSRMRKRVDTLIITDGDGIAATSNEDSLRLLHKHWSTVLQHRDII